MHCGRVLLSAEGVWVISVIYISTISVPYQYHIRAISVPYQWWYISVPYQYHISAISVPYQYHISTISVPHQYHISGAMIDSFDSHHCGSYLITKLLNLRKLHIRTCAFSTFSLEPLLRLKLEIARTPHPPLHWRPNDPEKKRTTHLWRDFSKDKERTGQHKNSFYWNPFDDITAVLIRQGLNVSNC